MTIKTAGHKSLIIILITAAVLCICGSVFAGNAKNKAKNGNDLPLVKLPEFKDAKDIKFDEDDQNYFNWLNKYFPEEAEMVKVLENNPKEYYVKFRANKSRFRRLWKGYKENKKSGVVLVDQVKLRWQRNRILDKYKSSKDKKSKETLYKELYSVVSKEFDIAMEIKKIKYDPLRPRIHRLKNHLTRHEAKLKQYVENKEAEVKKRVDVLIKEGKVDPNWIYPKNKGIAPRKDPSVKLAVLKDAKFTEDDQKFFAWLYEFFPDYAQDIKDLEKNPKEYVDEFKKNRTMFRRVFRRVWRGYKFPKQYEKILVDEVKLRVERFGVLNELKTANDKQKAKLRNDLSKIVSKEFDVAAKLSNGWVNELRKRIKRNEKDLAKRIEEVNKLVANKDREIKKRVEEHIKGEGKVNW